MLKKIISIGLLSFCVFGMTGCGAKIVKEEKINKSCIIKEIKHTDSYTTHMPVTVGKTITIRSTNHPETNIITVNYNNLEYTLDNKDLYNKIKSKNLVNKEIECVIKRTYYEDKTIKEDIEKLDI